MTFVDNFKVFLTNLGKYNEGDLEGKWIELPIDEDDFKEELKAIGVDGKKYEEFFITDYENDFGIVVNQYDNIDDLNDLANEIASLDKYHLDILESLRERETINQDSLRDIILGNELKNYSLDYTTLTEEDVANQYIDNVLNSDLEMDEIIMRNIDRKSLGKELLDESQDFLGSYGLLKEI